MILNDLTIQSMCKAVSWMVETEDGRRPMIEPFSEGVSGNGVISYGLTSAGYDLRLDPSAILLFKNTFCEVVDPKRFKDDGYRERVFDRRSFVVGQGVPIPAHGYILGKSMEYLRIPNHLKGTCVGKSTYARCGIIVNVTPLEPGWEGYLTIEIANTNPCTALVYAGEGIAQLEFHLLNEASSLDYRAKGGKYQNQQGVTPAIVR